MKFSNTATGRATKGNIITFLNLVFKNHLKALIIESKELSGCIQSDLFLELINKTDPNFMLKLKAAQGNSEALATLKEKEPQCALEIMAANGDATALSNLQETDKDLADEISRIRTESTYSAINLIFDNTIVAMEENANKSIESWLDNPNFNLLITTCAIFEMNHEVFTAMLNPNIGKVDPNSFVAYSPYTGKTEITESNLYMLATRAYENPSPTTIFTPNQKQLLKDMQEVRKEFIATLFKAPGCDINAPGTRKVQRDKNAQPAGIPSTASESLESATAAPSSASPIIPASSPETKSNIQQIIDPIIEKKFAEYFTPTGFFHKEYTKEQTTLLENLKVQGYKVTSEFLYEKKIEWINVTSEQHQELIGLLNRCVMSDPRMHSRFSTPTTPIADIEKGKNYGERTQELNPLEAAILGGQTATAINTLKSIKPDAPKPRLNINISNEFGAQILRDNPFAQGSHTVVNLAEMYYERTIAATSSEEFVNNLKMLELLLIHYPEMATEPCLKMPPRSQSQPLLHKVFLDLFSEHNETINRVLHHLLFNLNMGICFDKASENGDTRPHYKILQHYHTIYENNVYLSFNTSYDLRWHYIFLLAPKEKFLWSPNKKGIVKSHRCFAKALENLTILHNLSIDQYTEIDSTKTTATVSSSVKTRKELIALVYAKTCPAKYSAIKKQYQISRFLSDSEKDNTLTGWLNESYNADEHLCQMLLNCLLHGKIQYSKDFTGKDPFKGFSYSREEHSWTLFVIKWILDNKHNLIEALPCFTSLLKATKTLEDIRYPIAATCMATTFNPDKSAPSVPPILPKVFLVHDLVLQAKWVLDNCNKNDQRNIMDTQLQAIKQHIGASQYKKYLQELLNGRVKLESGQASSASPATEKAYIGLLVSTINDCQKELLGELPCFINVKPKAEDTKENIQPAPQTPPSKKPIPTRKDFTPPPPPTPLQSKKEPTSSPTQQSDEESTPSLLSKQLNQKQILTPRQTMSYIIPPESISTSETPAPAPEVLATERQNRKDAMIITNNFFLTQPITPASAPETSASETSAPAPAPAST